MSQSVASKVSNNRNSKVMKLPLILKQEENKKNPVDKSGNKTYDRKLFLLVNNLSDTYCFFHFFI